MLLDELDERSIASPLLDGQLVALGVSGEASEALLFQRPLEHKVERNIFGPLRERGVDLRQTSPLSEGMIEVDLLLTWDN